MISVPSLIRIKRNKEFPDKYGAKLNLMQSLNMDHHRCCMFLMQAHDMILFQRKYQIQSNKMSHRTTHKTKKIHSSFTLESLVIEITSNSSSQWIGFFLLLLIASSVR